MVSEHILIVGSGPAAVAAVWALADRGVKPTLWDIGETLDPIRRGYVEALAKPGGINDPVLREQASHNETFYQDSFPSKYYFGSDYFLGGNRDFAPTITRNTLKKIGPSYAKGGSAVGWGGAILPIRPKDMAHWPISYDQLRPSFKRIMQHLPLTGERDALEQLFPLHGKDPYPFPTTPQTDWLLRRWRNSPQAILGKARLAIYMRDNPDTGVKACIQCGLCLSGCPFGSIYSFEKEIERLIKEGFIVYKPKHIVTHVQEEGERVKVHALNLDGSFIKPEYFDRVFLAAGPVGSSRIILESMGWFDRTIKMQDSQKFILPLLTARAFNLAWPHMIAIGNLFLESQPPALQGDHIHAQLSLLSGPILANLQRIIGIQNGWRYRFFRPGLEHLMVAFAGLPSHLSGHLDLKLLRAHRKGRPILHIHAVPSKRAHRAARKASLYWMRIGIRHGILFLPPFIRMAPPGAGYHFGGSLPMRSFDKRETVSTDPLGRLWGLERVHIVDGSILPQIPSTTPTLTIMANADRIVRTVNISS